MWKTSQLHHFVKRYVKVVTTKSFDLYLIFVCLYLICVKDITIASLREEICENRHNEVVRFVFDFLLKLWYIHYTFCLISYKNSDTYITLFVNFLLKLWYIHYTFCEFLTKTLIHTLHFFAISYKNSDTYITLFVNFLQKLWYIHCTFCFWFVFDFCMSVFDLCERHHNYITSWRDMWKSSQQSRSICIWFLYNLCIICVKDITITSLREEICESRHNEFLSDLCLICVKYITL